MVERWNVIVTASEDTSVRLWTLDGSYIGTYVYFKLPLLVVKFTMITCTYIGTFGQEKQWKLGDPLSYQHPMGPRDILLDISSVPEIEEPEPPSPEAISRKTHPQAPLKVTELENNEEVHIPSFLPMCPYAECVMRLCRIMRTSYSPTTSA